MYSSVKAFLNEWCQRNRLPPPSYARQDGARPIKANGTISNQPSGFHAELRIAGVDYVARGFHKSIKESQNYAARNMISHLCTMGRMVPRELYKVAGASDIADDFCKGKEEKAKEAAEKEAKAKEAAKAPPIIDRIKAFHSRFQRGEVVTSGRTPVEAEAPTPSSGQQRKRGAADDSGLGPSPKRGREGEGGEATTAPEVVELEVEHSSSPDIPTNVEANTSSSGYSLDDLTQRVRARVSAAKDGLARLSEGILQHYAANKQDEEVFAYKVEIRTRLLAEFERLFQGATSEVHLFITGSTVNGCGSYNSDMDLCLVLVDQRGRLDTDREYAMRALRHARLGLQRNFRPFFEPSSLEVIPAKVPILRLTIPGDGASIGDLELDINCNNTAGIRNSHLLHHYAALDDRYGALALALKHWAIKADINSAQHGTLNSYSLLLLLLHYLQTVPSPPVLPNLQGLLPEIFNADAPILSLELFKTPPELEGWKSENTDSVGALLLGFFHYMAEFPFKTAAVCIRHARVLHRRQTTAWRPNHQLMVEEPYDLGNTARCVNRPDCFAAIVAAFKAAVAALQKRADLEAIDVIV